jgi:pimeloyl-ACP methyl ester carboxylesterase
MVESFNSLMQALGYPTYVAQGGDIGSFLSRLLGHTYPESCRAVLVNMLLAPEPTFTKSPSAWFKWRTAPQLFYTKVEMDQLSRIEWFSRKETGYQVPLTYI